MTAKYRFVGGQSRTTVVRAGRDAVVFSPGLPLVEDADVGDASRIWLIAPSVGHTLGIVAWSERFPEARVVAAPPTAARLSIAGAVGPASLELDGVRAVVPPGSGTGEVWLRVDADDRTHWIVADAYLNLTALAPGLWLRLAQRLYGLRTGLTFGRAFRSRLTDRRAYQAWLEQSLDPAAHHVLIPCHGEIDDGSSLRERLLAVSDRTPRTAREAAD